jgi:23S rRNA maturation mini-RNase III
MAVEAVAADTEVVEAVELDIAAELVVSMAQGLLDPVASVVSHEPWCVVYGI